MTDNMALWYLRESGGSSTEYIQRGLAKERVGQAFYNALSETDKNRIRGTLFDPFNRDTHQAILDAIDFLTK